MPKQKLNMTIGRFQPFTVGHSNMINEGEAPCIVYRINSDKPMEIKKNGSIKFGSKTYTQDVVKRVVEYIENPTGELNEKEKELLKRPFTNELIEEELNIVKKSNKNIIDIINVTNAYEALARFNKFILDNKDKYEPQYWMCGDDRVENYSNIIADTKEGIAIERNGEEYENVIKGILTTNTGNGRTEGVSGTDVRKSILTKDKASFAKIMPKGVDQMFDKFVNAFEDFKDKIKETIKESRIENYIKYKNMKSIKEYIVNEAESNTNWIQDILDNVQKINSTDKVEVYTALYRLEHDSVHLDIRNGYGHLWEEPKKWSSYVYVVSALDICVFTTDKGNLYGVNISYFKNSPALLKMFNRRLKGTKGKYWTDNIETLRKFLDEKVSKRSIDKMPEGYNWFGYGLFTSEEKAEAAAEKVSKINKLEVKTIWNEDKIAELKKLLQAKNEEIQHYQEMIEKVKDEIKDINDDIIEYENMKNVASDDFNESLEEN